MSTAQRRSERAAALAKLTVALILCIMLAAACDLVPSMSSDSAADTTSPQSGPSETTPQPGAQPQDSNPALQPPADDRLPETTQERLLETDEVASVVSAHNRLGFLLLADLTTGLVSDDAGQQRPTGPSGDLAVVQPERSPSTLRPNNIVLSPVSVALALSLAQNGAAGETASAMARAMQQSSLLDAGLTGDSINAANQALMQRLHDAAAAGDIRLEIANALWHRDDLSLVPGFVNASKQYFQAEVSSLDFASPQSVDTINAWVDKATQGLIPRLVDEIADDLAVLIANAVYFKGEWQTPFDPNLTRPLPFTLLSGDRADVEMMYRSGSIQYYEEDFQAIRLPYGTTDRTAMYVFLPPMGESVEAFAAQFQRAAERALGNFRAEEGEVWLPRLDVSYKASLKEPLGRLGMETAFDPVSADFSRMIHGAGPGDAFIGDVLHQAVLTMDETGTEAAAVTSVEVRLTSLPIRRVAFRADRPFLFFIRDDESGMILFAGVVVDPRGAE